MSSAHTRRTWCAFHAARRMLQAAAEAACAALGKDRPPSCMLAFTNVPAVAISAMAAAALSVAPEGTALAGAMWHCARGRRAQQRLGHLATLALSVGLPPAVWALSVGLPPAV
eukprot:43082-Chlamydomonas_euryale.AAC.1